jgi:dCTP deaminase
MARKIMILTGPAIHEAVKAGDIVIDPFSPTQLNPNSYDFRLGSNCRTYDCDLLDSAKENPSTLQSVTTDGLVLSPSRIYLFDTLEIIGSKKYVPIIRARSSAARLGLFIHVTADLIDIGSINRLTLQLHAVEALRVYPSMLIGQATFWVPCRPEASCCMEEDMPKQIRRRRRGHIKISRSQDQNKNAGGIYDPVHGSVTFAGYEIPGSLPSIARILDAPMMRRLRLIKQNSFASYRFLSADHTRYFHALGTMQVLKKLIS